MEVSSGEIGVSGGGGAAVLKSAELGSEPSVNVSWPLFTGLAAAVVLFDQLLKSWIRTNIALGGKLDLLPGWVHLSHTLNAGAAWGMLSGQRWLLILVSVVVSGFIILLTREMAVRGKCAVAALGLVLGGAIGNLIDRIASGVVTDMIDLDTPIEYLRTFPVFNIADSALTVGVILLIIVCMINKPAPAPAPGSGE